jgi:hypothetical protein
MSYALNNTATANSYGSCTLACAGSVKANITIANAAVLMTPTFRDVAGNETTGAEVFLPPGFYSYRRPIDQLQFRSGVSGTPALVTVEALMLKEANQ